MGLCLISILPAITRSVAWSCVGAMPCSFTNFFQIERLRENMETVRDRVPYRGSGIGICEIPVAES